MKKSLYLLINLSLVLLITACARVDYSQQAVFPEANADQALIYFYRTPGLIGSTYRFNVSEKQQIVGAMAQDSYFYLWANSGEHTYSVDDGNEQHGSVITLNVQAGKTYYVKVDIKFGGRPVFTQVDETQAMKLLHSRKYVVPAKTDPSNYNIHLQ